MQADWDPVLSPGSGSHLLGDHGQVTSPLWACALATFLIALLQARIKGGDAMLLLAVTETPSVVIALSGVMRRHGLCSHSSVVGEAVSYGNGSFGLRGVDIRCYGSQGSQGDLWPS